MKLEGEKKMSKRSRNEIPTLDDLFADDLKPRSPTLQERLASQEREEEELLDPIVKNLILPSKRVMDRSFGKDYFRTDKKGDIFTPRCFNDIKLEEKRINPLEYLIVQMIEVIIEYAGIVPTILLKQCSKGWKDYIDKSEAAKRIAKRLVLDKIVPSLIFHSEIQLFKDSEDTRNAGRLRRFYDIAAEYRTNHRAQDMINVDIEDHSVGYTLMLEPEVRAAMFAICNIERCQTFLLCIPDQSLSNNERLQMRKESNSVCLNNRGASNTNQIIAKCFEFYGITSDGKHVELKTSIEIWNHVVRNDDGKLCARVDWCRLVQIIMGKFTLIESLIEGIYHEKFKEEQYLRGTMLHSSGAFRQYKIKTGDKWMIDARDSIAIGFRSYDQLEQFIDKYYDHVELIKNKIELLSDCSKFFSYPDPLGTRDPSASRKVEAFHVDFALKPKYLFTIGDRTEFSEWNWRKMSSMIQVITTKKYGFLESEEKFWEAVLDMNKKMGGTISFSGIAILNAVINLMDGSGVVLLHKRLEYIDTITRKVIRVADMIPAHMFVSTGSDPDDRLREETLLVADLDHFVDVFNMAMEYKVNTKSKLIDMNISHWALKQTDIFDYRP